LRAQTPELLDGRRDLVDVQFDEALRWLVVKRGSITLQVNFGSQPVQLPRPNGQPLLSFPEHPSGDQQVTLGPESCSVWR
jgi:maltooligosyltrehalose trehalohydrolase